MNPTPNSGSTGQNVADDAGSDREEFADGRTTYTLQVGDRFVVIENVPVRESVRTGEQLFAPETVERLQQIVWESRPPVRTLETPVYEFPAVA